MAWNSNPWYEDDFNRSDSDTVGDGWSERYGDLDIVSNGLKAIGANSLLRYDALDLSETATPADYVVEFDFDFDTPTNFIFIIGRWNGTDNGAGDPLQCYFLYLQPTGASGYAIYIYKRTTSVAGQTLLGSSSGTMTGLKKVRLEMLGTALDAIVDGVTKISVTDSTHTSQGYCGIRIGTNQVVDNFAIYSESAPPTYLNLTETITLADTCIKSVTRALVESLLLLDVLTKASTKLLVDSLILSDTFIKSITRSLSETLPLVDTVNKATTRVLTEALALVDTITKTPGKVLTETITLVDTITALIVGFYQVILTETITLTDSLTAFKEWWNNITRNWFTKIEDE